MKKKLCLALCLMLAIGVLAGCTQTPAETGNPAATASASAQASEKPSAKPSAEKAPGKTIAEKTVYIGMESEPETIDTSTSGLDLARWCSDACWGHIVFKDETGTVIVPDVAESWKYLSDTQVEFKIRNDVVFHNGRPLTADDIVYTIQFQLEKANGGVQYSYLAPHIKSVEATDDYTVLVTLNEVYAPFLTYLTKIPILCKEAMATNATAPVSCGPFKFVSWDKNQNMKFEAFEDYYRDDKPTYRNLVYKFYADQNACLTAFLAGEVDIINWMSNLDIPTVEASGNAYVQGAPSSQFYVQANQSNKILSTPGVMKAISLAFDKEQMVDLILDGYGEAISIPMAHSSDYYPDDIDFSQNIDEAKRLLSEAGYQNGFEVSLLAPQTAVEGLFAEVVQAQLAKVGITVKLNVLEVPAFLEEWAAGNFELAICGHGIEADPAVRLNKWMTEDTSNYGHYSNTKFDELCKKATATVDEAARKELYYDAYHLFVNDSMIIYCIADARYSAVKNNISHLIKRFPYTDFTELVVQ